MASMMIDGVNWRMVWTCEGFSAVGIVCTDGKAIP